MRLRRRVRRPLLGAVVLVVGIGPLATDAYLPALPSMTRTLGGSATVLQLTLTAFIVGSALGQFVAGPLSDGGGRRPYLLGGTLAFTALSAACALAPSAEVLVALRLLQGGAAGFGMACGRATVSDSDQGTAAAQRFGTLASITLLAPVIAPALGSVILAHGDWRWVFWLLTALGAVMVAAVAVAIPESLPPAQRHPGGLVATGARMRDLMRHRPFVRHVLVTCLTTCGFFTYIGGSSFVLQQVYGISQTGYALVFTVNALAMVCASVGFRLLVARVGAERLRTVGLVLAVVAAHLLLGVALAGRGLVPWLAVPWALLSCLTAGMGLLIPALTALAQRDGDEARGTAAALQGGGGFLVGALVTPLTGIVGSRSMLPMAGFMALFMASAAVTFGLTRSWVAEPALPAPPVAAK